MALASHEVITKSDAAAEWDDVTVGLAATPENAPHFWINDQKLCEKCALSDRAAEQAGHCSEGDSVNDAPVD